MNAGRELDALVAEKVMGFQWVDEWQGLPGPYLVSPHPYLAGWRRDDGGITAHLDGVTPDVVLPNYSTDIAAAMELFPKLRERGWVYLTIQSLPERADSPEWNEAIPIAWWAEFSRYRSAVEVTSDDCASPAEAICLAALKAVAA